MIVRHGRGAALVHEPYAATAAKLGRVATTSTPADQSCPHDCKLWNSCYYRKGLHLGRVNRTLEDQSMGASPLQVAYAEAAGIDQLKGDVPLRLHVGGDARTPDAASVVGEAAQRYAGRGGQPVFTFTHAWRTVQRRAWGASVSVLASVETTAEARRAMARGYAAAITVPSHPADGKAWRAGKLRVIPCPEQTKGRTCAQCRLCMDAGALRRRGAVIAFAMHGSGNKRGRRRRPVTWRGRVYRSLRAAADAAGLPYPLVRARREVHKWTLEEALSTPLRPKRGFLRVVGGRKERQAPWVPVVLIDKFWRRIQRRGGR